MREVSKSCAGFQRMFWEVSQHVEENLCMLLGCSHVKLVTFGVWWARALQLDGDEERDQATRPPA